MLQHLQGSTRLPSDKHLLAAPQNCHTDIQAYVFLAKYYADYVMYINIVARYNAWLPQGFSYCTYALLASAIDRYKYKRGIMYLPLFCHYCDQVHLST